jgi:hypothetical protein
LANIKAAHVSGLVDAAKLDHAPSLEIVLCETLTGPRTQSNMAAPAEGPVQSQGDVYAKIFAIRQNDQAAQRAV